MIYLLTAVGLLPGGRKRALTLEFLGANVMMFL